MTLMMKRQLKTDTRVSMVFALALVGTACSSDSSESPQPQLPAGSGGLQPPAAGTQAAGATAQAGDYGRMVSGASGRNGAGTSAGAAGAPGTGAAGTGLAGIGAAGAGAAGVGAAGMVAAGMGAAGMNPQMMPPGPVTLPVCDKGPAQFDANPSVGGGGSQFKDSPHFRIYGATDAQADEAFKELEAAYSCFVDTLCWRSPGLSIKDTANDGPFYKMNFYVVGSLGSAAGQMFSDAATGLAYEKVVASYLNDPKVAVHEYGHALTYAEKGWIDQTRTGAWWEPVANFVADTYMTSPLCAKSRMDHGVTEGKTIIDLDKVIGSSFRSSSTRPRDRATTIRRGRS
jgi:hypothetical protein